MEQRCFQECWESCQFKHFNVCCLKKQVSFPHTEVPLVSECAAVQVRGQGGHVMYKKGDIQWGGMSVCAASSSCLQQGFAQLPHPALFPVPLHYSVLIIFLFFSAGKELREDNKDYQQVLLDVRRSLRRFPPGERGFSSSHSARGRSVPWSCSWLRPYSGECSRRCSIAPRA